MKFALVSTLDDGRGTFVMLFDTEKAANEYGIAYLKRTCPERFEDHENLDDFTEELDSTEWFFVIGVSHVPKDLPVDAAQV